MGEVSINTDEFEAAQAAKEQQQQSESDANGDDLILGKFLTQADLEKSYVELQQKLSGGQAADDNAENPTTNDGAEEAQSLEISTEEETQEESDDLAPLINIESIDKEWSETGTLSEDTIGNLEKAGIPKERMDLYMRGIEALSKQTAQQGFDLVGGQSEYTNMINWAKGSLSQSEAQDFNDAVDINANAFVREAAILAMHGKYVKANGGETNLLQGSTSFPTGTVAFKNQAEQQAYMSDPRWKTDAAYRDEGTKRILASARQ